MGFWDKLFGKSKTTHVESRAGNLQAGLEAEGLARKEMTLTLAPGVTMAFVRVPAGEFTMGSNDGYDDERPPHRVRLDEFWMGKYLVTVAQFAAFVRATGYKTTDEKAGYDRNWQHPRGPQSDVTRKANHPVTRVSWPAALAFCKWASDVTGVRVRLPTEAEWEKAARGTDGRIYPWGNSSPDSSLLNFNRNVGDTTKVGGYPDGASPYGVLDMAGNVSEWVADWYKGSYYANSPSENPVGPSSGSGHVLRGGSWSSDEDVVRAAARGWGDPSDSFSYDNVGFRCACSP